jgi:NAD(P)H-hydrate repair Nnr-like enzyme with NAD(P)H-hydrate dehydratase domain
MDNIQIFASNHASGHVDDKRAVIVTPHPQFVMTLTIAEARDIANRLAKAADEAEAKLQ